MCPWVGLIFLGFWILIYKVGMLTFYYYPLLLLFSRSVMADSLQPHGLQHARVPCPSPSPGVYSNSCPLSQWCHPTISSSVIPFSSCPQSFPASRSFPISQHFASGGQSIGASASASVLPVNIQGWSPCSPRLSRVFSNSMVQKHPRLLKSANEIRCVKVLCRL